MWDDKEPFLLKGHEQRAKVSILQSLNCRYKGDISINMYRNIFKSIKNERKSEQAHIPHAPTLLENAVYNEWQFQALVTGNLTKKGT